MIAAARTQALQSVNATLIDLHGRVGEYVIRVIAEGRDTVHAPCPSTSFSLRRRARVMRDKITPIPDADA